eukprot:TRINITY_DN19964_c0_g3_i1.p1 TRINITY_DN19964_c0_g3~~TRINITY_DN19964_c0_g3_i1.p1  ORF type:complete len:345 (+),score=43.67 TRINITY_DN19964_c0_g3_i1:55-1089(+)
MANVPEAVQVETMADAPALKIEETESPSGVGVLGWLGFIIINWAIWGIIAVSTVVNWVVGVLITLIYTGILVAIALLLPRWGDRFKSFENLFWVLACTLVFVLGLFLSINVVAAVGADNGSSINPGPTEGPRWKPEPDLVKLLPNASSEALTSWVKTRPAKSSEKSSPTYLEVNGNWFFSGASNITGFNKVLVRSGPSGAKMVLPSIQDARCLVQLGSDMYVLGRTNAVKAGLFQVTSANAAAAVANLVVSVPDDRYPTAEHLIVDSGKLYFKARQWCERDNSIVETVYESDGTTAGTRDLRQDACVRIPEASTSTSTTTYAPSVTRGKPVAALWGTTVFCLLA